MTLLVTFYYNLKVVICLLLVPSFDFVLPADIMACSVDLSSTLLCHLVYHRKSCLVNFLGAPPGALCSWAIRTAIAYYLTIVFLDCGCVK